MRARLRTRERELLLTTTSAGWARTITVVSYNVQNLFDATDDGGEYHEFTRAGGWTSELYTAKLRAIGSALRTAEPGGADLVALQEVEHYGAARRLVSTSSWSTSIPSSRP